MNAALAFEAGAAPRVPEALDRDWPHRSASRLVEAGGLRWHVQVMGTGPVALLLHGTGASTHSWRGLAPLLAETHQVVMPDLPGQGFTTDAPAEAMSLPGMSRAIAALLADLRLSPELVIGHSAGAAIGARLCLDGQVAPRLLVALNGAVLPLGGWAGQTFSPLARLLVGLPGVPTAFSLLAAQRRVVERLLRDTGSTLDAAGVELYLRLFRRPSHVSAALAMMASWDLHGLSAELPRLAAPLLLVVGDRDRTIHPRDQARVRRLVRAARLVSLSGLGHLAHEEAPERVAQVIREAIA